MVSHPGYDREGQASEFPAAVFEEEVEHAAFEEVEEVEQKIED